MNESFKWGVSSAAFQVEGDAGIKGPSIWDTFSSRKGKIWQGHHARVACDFFSRYADDIALLARLGIPNFRFSLAWSRILPTGTGALNVHGLDFYDRVIDRCLEAGVDPWLTLYHWDLPQALEDKGGWTNRDVVNWMGDYSERCALHFGDRVKHWMVLNEPMVFTGAGYFLGVHAPGRRGMKHFIPAVHHAVLATAEGGRRLREHLPKDASIGTTFSFSYIEPATSRRRDQEAATRVDAVFNRLFLEPALGLGYPIADAPVLKRLETVMLPGDREKMAFDFDFIGIQNYTRELVRHSLFTPYIRARLVAAEKRAVPLTEMKWEVHPPSIYQILKKVSAYPGVKSIVVTENGAAFPDTVTGDRVHDPLRVDYLDQHIAMVLKAKEEGSPVDGYFVWTLTDNFEWAEGYRPRFGLVHVDFDTQQRRIKDSGFWYSDFIRRRF